MKTSPTLSKTIVVEPMQSADITAVARIENAAYTITWPDNAFHHEIEENRLAHYFVAKQDGDIIGFGGIWVIMEEAHITTIAVDPRHQRKYIGELLLNALLDEAIRREAAWMTLEVRVSNVAAQQLYRKYHFAIISRRPAYYSDNQEDALVMWAGDLRGELYADHLAAMRCVLQQRLG